MNIGEKFYCSRCMLEIEDEEEKCPHCKYDPYQSTEKHMLEEGTLLSNGRYQIGAVIGSGGFGITYAAWDRKFDQPVAIKEYYSKGLCERDTTEDDTVTVRPDTEYVYQKGLDRFIREAKILNTLENVKNVVPVIEWFEANNTAYIVMKYIRGVTLEEYVKKNNIQPQKLIAMMRDIVDALALIHKQGIIHRDISPTNIMVQEDGTMLLIDFGAAALEEQQGKGNTVIFNRKYAPPEQYDESGMQGPWTDVYALSATIYTLICGEPPLESVARVGKDTLKSPLELGVHIKRYQNKAIMNGLTLKPEKRIQNMEIFRSVLYNLPMPEEVMRRRRFMFRVVSAAALIILVSILIMINYSFGFSLGNGLRFSLYGDGLHVRGFSSESENVSVPSKIAGLNVIQIDDGAFQGSETLRDVHVPGSVENIGRFAFNGCMNLMNVTLDEGVKRISSQAFANCNNLQAVMIPDSLNEIAPDAFMNSSERLVLIGYMNNKANELAERYKLNYSHIETEEKESGVTITKYETSQDRANIPDYINRRPVTAIERRNKTAVFPNSIRSVILPKNLIRIGESAFQGTQITSIEFPDTLEYIGEAAFNMTLLESIYLPDSVKSVGMGAFDLTRIETARLSPNMTVIPDLCFEFCDRLKSVTMYDGITEIGYGAFSKCFSLRSLVLPGTIKRISYRAFEDCISLEALHLPSSLESMPFSALRGCSNNLMITGFGTTFAQKFCEANGFRFYDLLTHDPQKFPITESGELLIENGLEESISLSLPSYGMGVPVRSVRNAARVGGERVSSIRSMYLTLPERLENIATACFAQNNYLERVICPDTLRVIGASAFAECPNLKEIELNEGLTDIGTAAFLSCTSLKHIKLPSSVKNLMAGAFEGCTNLIEVNIPSSIIVLNDDVFSDTGLTSVDIPGNITRCGTAFYGCKSLVRVTIEEGTNTLEGTFAECDSLETVIIPSSMKQITHSTFKGCKNLRDIWIYSDNVELDAYAFVIIHGSYRAVSEGTSIHLRQDRNKHLFSDCPNVTIHAHRGSSSHQYALKHNIRFEEIPSDREVTLMPQENYPEDEYWLTKRWEPSEGDDDRHLLMKAKLAWGYGRKDIAFRCLDEFAKCEGEFKEYHGIWVSLAKLFIAQSESHGYSIGQIIGHFEDDRPHPVLKVGDIIVECEGHTLDYEHIDELGIASGADTWETTILRADENNILQKVIVTSSKNNPRVLTIEIRPLRADTN